jgi:hypothetical protein
LIEAGTERLRKTSSNGREQYRITLMPTHGRRSKMADIDWDQIVDLRNAVDVDFEAQRQSDVTGGEVIPFVKLAEAVRIVIEEWRDKPHLQDSAWINGEDLDLMGLPVIRAFYDQPDFPGRMAGKANYR